MPYDNVRNEKDLNRELDDPDDDDSKKKDFSIIGDVLELVCEALDIFF